MVPPKNNFFFLSYSLLFKHLKKSNFPKVTPKKRTIKKLYCIEKKCYVLLCPPLRTEPPTGEAAKLTDDVT
jgi:hypothetical protein